MSKLYFRYGAMNCGKSSALMQVAYNYEQNNKKVIVIKSEIDTKVNWMIPRSLIDYLLNFLSYLLIAC